MRLAAVNEIWLRSLLFAFHITSPCCLLVPVLIALPQKSRVLVSAGRDNSRTRRDFGAALPSPLGLSEPEPKTVPKSYILAAVIAVATFLPSLRTSPVLLTYVINVAFSIPRNVSVSAACVLRDVIREVGSVLVATLKTKFTGTSGPFVAFPLFAVPSILSSEVHPVNNIALTRTIVPNNALIKFFFFITTSVLLILFYLILYLKYVLSLSGSLLHLRCHFRQRGGSARVPPAYCRKGIVLRRVRSVLAGRRVLLPGA